MIPGGRNEQKLLLNIVSDIPKHDLWFSFMCQIKIVIDKEMCRKPIFQHPDLGPSLHAAVEASTCMAQVDVGLERVVGA